jgi:hypothetical protein
MPINNFVRDNLYFQNARDRHEKMNAIDFDSQFNNVVSFINSQVIFTLNELLAQRIPGSTAPGDVGKFFQNVGDGTFALAFIDNSAFQDYSIEFTKLSRANPGSIFASGQDLSFQEISATESNQILASRANNAPTWRKILNADIADRQITADKIMNGSITNENFVQGLLLATQLLDNTITAPKIADRTIPASKMQDGSIDETVYGVAAPLRMWANVLADNVFTGPITFVPITNGEFTTTFDPNSRIPRSKFAAGCFYPVPNEQIFQAGSIANYQIRDNSINGSRFFYNPTVPLSRRPIDEPNNLIADGGIDISSFPANYKNVLGL